MYTNNVPSGAFRGFGVTQSAFAMESQMDVRAEALGLSPLEIRRKNVLAYGKKTLAGQVMTESCGLPQCLEAVAAEMEKHPFAEGEGEKGRAGRGVRRCRGGSGSVREWPGECAGRGGRDRARAGRRAGASGE